MLCGACVRSLHEMLNARTRHHLDDGVDPTTAEQLRYVLNRTVRRFIKLTATDSGSVKDVNVYTSALGAVEATRRDIERDFVDPYYPG